MSNFLHGRLGLETARIPHADRHGLLWLSRGKLYVEAGTLHFIAAATPDMKAGNYQIPFQTLTALLLGPGGTVSHDALRLLARHGAALLAVGEGGVRLYSAPPLGSHDSALARKHARLWADGSQRRIQVARRMYAWRLGEIFPLKKDIAILRGMEGARMKKTYQLLAEQYGLTWRGRHYDRQNPLAADEANQAINHAATAVEAAATVAVAVTGSIPQLGFIHEDSANAFCLDIADLFRDEITLPVAFQSVRNFQKRPDITLDRHVRRLANEVFCKKKLVAVMIDRIKELFDADDGGSNT